METRQPKFKVGDKVKLKNNLITPTMEVIEIIYAPEKYPTYPFKYWCAKPERNSVESSSVYEENELVHAKA